MTLSTREVTLWVLLALIAATLGLIFAVSHMSHSVWYDESLTDIIARQPTFGGLVKSAMDLKAYPPAFFVVVRWVYSVDDSPDGMRLPSAVFGFLATLAVFALGRIAGGSVVGALAGAFFVLTPGALRYFSDGNAYTLLMLASAVSTVCLYRALETDRRLHWILYGASAALGLATHTIFVFHLGGQILAALWCRFVVKPNGTHRPPTGPMRMMLTMSVLLVLWLAWVALYMISGGMTRAVSLSAIWSPAMLLAVPGMYAGPLSFGTLLPLALWLLLQLAGAVALFLKRRRVFLFLLILTASSLLAICLFIKATLSYFALPIRTGLVSDRVCDCSLFDRPASDSSWHVAANDADGHVDGCRSVPRGGRMVPGESRSGGMGLPGVGRSVGASRTGDAGRRRGHCPALHLRHSPPVLLQGPGGHVSTEMDRGMVSRPGGTHCVDRKEAPNCVAGPLVFRKPEFLCQFLHGAARTKATSGCRKLRRTDRKGGMPHPRGQAFPQGDGNRLRVSPVGGSKMAELS